MKNKEMLNVCYKYLNRFILSEVLIEKLSNIDKTKLSQNDINKTNKMIDDIKVLMDKYPNEEDEYYDFNVEGFTNDYKMDSSERQSNIVNYIVNSDYFIEVLDNLTDYELLEFIAQYIHAPNPPSFTQEEFNKLVKAGIENDEREWLWRLAFNYESSNLDFSDIVDYYIEKKDGYYLSELISAIGNHLDINSIIDNIDDKELILDLKERKNILCSILKEEQFNKLIGKLD